MKKINRYYFLVDIKNKVSAEKEPTIKNEKEGARQKKLLFFKRKGGKIKVY